MEEKRISPLKAIRLKCMDCCGGSANDIRLCPAESCPLHPFRMGKNPYRTKREPTEKQLAALKSRVADKFPVNNGKKSANKSPEGNYIPQIKNGEKQQESEGKSNA